MESKSWQDEMRESAHKIWLAGLGALAVAEEEGSKLFTSLVQEGERFEAAGKERLADFKREVGDVTSRARSGAQGAWEKVEDQLDERLARALHRIGVPTREEIAALSRRVEELTAALERMRAAERGKTPAGKGRAGSMPEEITTAEDVTTTDDVDDGQR